MNRTVFFFGLFYGFVETAYFGWNWSPQSDAEIICDGIAMLIMAMAFLTPTHRQVHDMELVIEVKLRDEKYKPLVFASFHRTKSVTEDVLYQEIIDAVTKMIYQEPPKE